MFILIYSSRGGRKTILRVLCLVRVLLSGLVPVGAAEFKSNSLGTEILQKKLFYRKKTNFLDITFLYEIFFDIQEKNTL